MRQTLIIFRFPIPIPGTTHVDLGNLWNVQIFRFLQLCFSAKIETATVVSIFCLSGIVLIQKTKRILINLTFELVSFLSFKVGWLPARVSHLNFSFNLPPRILLPLETLLLSFMSLLYVLQNLVETQLFHVVFVAVLEWFYAWDYSLFEGRNALRIRSWNLGLVQLFRRQSQSWHRRKSVSLSRWIEGTLSLENRWQLGHLGVSLWGLLAGVGVFCC